MSRWTPSAAYNHFVNGHYAIAESRSIYGLTVFLSGGAVPGAASFSYEDFVTSVCRYRTSDVLRAISVQNEGLFAPQSYKGKPMVVNPWAASAIARESILHGNEEPPQRDLTYAELSELFTHFSGSYDHETPDENSVLRILAQIFNEQFVWQESVIEELARTAVLFRGGSTPDHQVIRRVVEQALGVSVEDAIAAALVLFGAADTFGGRWDPNMLENDELSDLFEIVPKQSIITFSQLLTADRNSFRTHHENAMSKVGGAGDTGGQRWGFNPLFTHPIFEMSPGECVIPLAWILPRRLSPSALYYDGISVGDQTFTSALGNVIEAYAGAQLQELEASGARVVPKFKYRLGGNVLESIDWFVELPDCLLFIEVKSTRLLLSERMGQLPSNRGIRSTLAEAFNQIDENVDQYHSGKTEFLRALPEGKPLLGLVITSEPIYHGNVSAMREQLPNPRIPISVASLRVLERIVMMDASILGRALLAILNDPDKSTWPLITAIAQVESPRENRILQEAADELPIFRWRPETPDDESQP